jgi:hypothetical protein
VGVGVRRRILMLMRVVGRKMDRTLDGSLFFL